MIEHDQSAVVFAYHNVGVRGLAVLLSLGVRISLLVTHRDDPQENIWFGSVRALAELNGIPVIDPDDPNHPEVVARVRAHRPQWLFSFYYRHLLGAELLALPSRGAYNLHGSLLPKYRGRVPVNWAVLHGETQTGASLHRMVAQPDAGALVDQETTPILPNDTAGEVFQKVTCAAERLLARSLPRLLRGESRERALDLRQGSYFGARRPQDGQIDWSRPAREIHNLIRAVAPPYPGAFFVYRGRRIDVLGSYFRGEAANGGEPRLYREADHWFADCRDGRRLLLLRVELERQPLSPHLLRSRFGSDAITLDQPRNA